MCTDVYFPFLYQISLFYVKSYICTPQVLSFSYRFINTSGKMNCEFGFFFVIVKTLSFLPQNCHYSANTSTNRAKSFAAASSLTWGRSTTGSASSAATLCAQAPSSLPTTQVWWPQHCIHHQLLCLTPRGLLIWTKTVTWKTKKQL